jgi:broad specificity phosphatase PhoE
VTRLILVRHGEAAAAWSDAPDPGLSPLGREQAQAVADDLRATAPCAIVSSPLRRARETAMPLEALWQRQAVIEPGVAEVPSSGIDTGNRMKWLAWFLTCRWADLDDCLRAWRDGVVATLTAMPEDTIVFTHYVAINVAVGLATGDDRVLCFRPGNGSRTVIDTDGTTLTLVARGDEAETKVN